MSKLHNELYQAVELTLKEIGLDEDNYCNNGFVVEGLIRGDKADPNKRTCVCKTRAELFKKACICKTPLKLFSEKKTEILERLETLERILHFKHI